MVSFPKIIVFGRGFGECILVQLDLNSWMVVDSFLHPKTMNPVALDYLESIQVSPDDISICLITHSHTDHIRGMCEIIEKAKNARIFVSDAFSSEEALGYYWRTNLVSGTDINGASEYIKILRYIKNNSLRRMETLKTDSVLLKLNKMIVCSISPSTKTVEDSRISFASLIKKSEGAVAKTDIPKTSPNDSSVVISISNLDSNECIILGADLEVINDNSDIGWDAAMMSQMAPKGRDITYFKIPHHGSINGFHKQTWDNHVKADIVAVLTTFNKSKKLPQENIVEIYKNYTKNLFSTTKPHYRKDSAFTPSAAKILKDIASSTTSVAIPKVKAVSPNNSYGYVESTYFQGMYKIEKLYQDATQL